MGILYVCLIVIADVYMGSCYECLAVRQCTAMYILEHYAHYVYHTVYLTFEIVCILVR
jgi:hypothetical protein